MHDVEGIKVLLDYLIEEERRGHLGSIGAQICADHAGSQAPIIESAECSAKLPPSHAQLQAWESLFGVDRAAAYWVLQGYLTAATAKDLSIMITLRKVCQGSNDARQSSKLTACTENCQGTARENDEGVGSMQSKVALVDLDMKPLAKVYEHWRLDRAIMQSVLGAGLDPDASVVM